MIQKNYEKAVAEVVLFDNSDVITTSGQQFFCMQPNNFDNNPNGCANNVTE